MALQPEGMAGMKGTGANFRVRVEAMKNRGLTGCMK